ncbi:MAG: DNA glycosylase [Methanocellales archaeon]
MEFYIENFNLHHTLNCGQVFRWRFNGREWIGIVKNSIVKAKQMNGILAVEADLDSEVISNYFRLDDDLEEIYSCIGRDKNIQRAIELYRGLRLIRQDPWECLISFVCSAASNIPRIQNMIENLCKNFGARIAPRYYSFPTPSRLSSATELELRKCGLGFRSAIVLEAAKLVVNREIDLDRLPRLDYSTAKEKLKAIKGVGDKIADCVLLFSCDKLEAFPVDRHIKRYIQRVYLKRCASNEAIRNFARNYFGKYCGYAQQYIFTYQRERRQLG